MAKNRNPLYVQQPRANGRFIPRDKPTAQPVCVALTYDIDEVVRQLPNRSEWLRRVITEAAQRELMGNAPQATDAVLPSPGLRNSTNVELEDATNGPAVAAPRRRGRKPKGETHE